MWEKKERLKPKMHGCLHATMQEILDMDEIIAVGFGDAHVEKDGEIIYHEPAKWELDEVEAVEDFESLFWTVQDAENEAMKDPDHDWRIVLYAPLRGRVFQRQEPGKWYLIEEDQGFA